MKKIIAIAMIVVLAVSAVVGGTFAYFTDRDAQKNTFTVGNVEIDLWEDFGDNQDDIENLIPAVKDEDGNLVNAVEKEVYVSVKEGSEDVYARVHIAIPQILDNGADEFDASKNVLHFNYAPESIEEGKWNWKTADGTNWNYYETEINDITYNVYVVTYQSVLKAGETTVDAIHQVYLDSQTTQEDIAKINETLNGNWHIYVVAEAGQASGFTNAYTALDTQFGVPGEYEIDWNTSKGEDFKDTETIPESVSESLEG